MDKQSLFRPEVLVEQQTQWLGTILLAPRLSHRLFTVFALITTTAIFGLLFFADYTRKARISGWLVPQHGLVRIFAPQAGVVTALYVQEGVTVRKGDHLFALSTELQSAALGATQGEIARRLIARRDSLVEARQQHQRLTAQQSQSLRHGQELSYRLRARKKRIVPIAMKLTGFDIERLRLIVGDL